MDTGCFTFRAPFYKALKCMINHIDFSGIPCDNRYAYMLSGPRALSGTKLTRGYKP